ncbi:MAG: hypothetical protein LUE61_00240 [Clostridiales bacterium]|nr:hypothetical protein [Clostridiales bacterium]
MKRKTRNRIISLLLAAALLVTLGGCGRVAQGDDGSALSSASSVAAEQESASDLLPEESAQPEPEESSGLEPEETSSDLEPEAESSAVTPEEASSETTPEESSDPEPEENTDPEPETTASEAKPEESVSVPEKTGGTQTIDQQIDTLLAGMTLEEKIWQLFVVTPEQLVGTDTAVTSWSSALTKALAEKPVGGLILFKQNIVSRSQTKSLLSDAQSNAEYGLLLSVDEEGGTVARVSGNSNMGYASIPNMADIGATGDTDEAYQVGLTLGKELTELGFNLDFAPVADVDSNPNNPVIGVRSFGSDPELVADMVAAAVKGFHQGACCVPSSTSPATATRTPTATRASPRRKRRWRSCGRVSCCPSSRALRPGRTASWWPTSPPPTGGQHPRLPVLHAGERAAAGRPGL